MTENEIIEKRSNSLKNERQFLEEMDAVKTENGNYIYISQDGNDMMKLDVYLQTYKEWLIDNKLITK